MSFPSLPVLTVIVALLSACGAKSKSESPRVSMPIEPQVVMSAFYESKSKKMNYRAQLHFADAYEQEAVSFFGDGTALPLIDVDDRRYELDRAPMESAATMPVALEFRSSSPTITRNFDMHAATVTAAPAVVSLKDGFKVGFSGEPLAAGEELEVVFKRGGVVWAYSTFDSATIEGGELVVGPDAKPKIRSLSGPKIPPPGAYEMAIERNRFMNLYERDILVSGGVRYQSLLTPVTIKD